MFCKGEKLLNFLVDWANSASSVVYELQRTWKNYKIIPTSESFTSVLASAPEELDQTTMVKDP